MSGSDRCSAWVYRPSDDGDAAPRPAVVLANGFGGTKGIRLHAFAERFADAGFVAIPFDFRSFGDSGGTPRRVLSIGAQRADWDSAVAFARTLDVVDATKVAAWGTSLSGGHVIDLAARDRQLAAAIAQVPHVSGFSAARAAGPLAGMRLARAALTDVVSSALGRGPVYAPVTGRPGETAFLTTPDAQPGFDRILDQSEDPTNENSVAARIALSMPLFSPARRAPKISCPILMQIASRDVVTPTAASFACAKTISSVEAKEYACAHFDPYVSPWFDRFVEDQIDFLQRHLL